MWEFVFTTDELFTLNLCLNARKTDLEYMLLMFRDDLELCDIFKSGISSIDSLLKKIGFSGF